MFTQEKNHSLFAKISKRLQNIFLICPSHWIFRLLFNKIILKHWSENKNRPRGNSLVVQWLRIHLPMQGTRVRALLWEDPTCRGATKPMCHNYWACALEPARHNYWACMPQLLKPTCLEPVLCNKRSYRNEKPVHCNEE